MAERAFDHHLTVHGFDDVLDDGQTKACPTECPGAASIDPIETLEQSWQVDRLDARAGVGHRDFDGARKRLSGPADDDLGPRGTVLDGVIKQVRQDLF